MHPQKMMMEPATIELIKVVATDAVKILGPAGIAAYATYQAAKAQFEIKLKELEKTHEFGAREHLFRFYKERQQKLSKDYERLSESLCHSLGYVAGYTENGERCTDSSMLKTFGETVEIFSKIAPIEIDVTARDMKRNDLSNSEDYSRLSNYKKKITALSTEKTFEALKKNIFLILELYHFLMMINQMLLQHQIDKVFVKYTEA